MASEKSLSTRGEVVHGRPSLSVYLSICLFTYLRAVDTREPLRHAGDLLGEDALHRAEDGGLRRCERALPRLTSLPDEALIQALGWRAWRCSSYCAPRSNGSANRQPTRYPCRSPDGAFGSAISKLP